MARKIKVGDDRESIISLMDDVYNDCRIQKADINKNIQKLNYKTSDEDDKKIAMARTLKEYLDLSDKLIKKKIDLVKVAVKYAEQSNLGVEEATKHVDADSAQMMTEDLKRKIRDLAKKQMEK